MRACHASMNLLNVYKSVETPLTLSALCCMMHRRANDHAIPVVIMKKVFQVAHKLLAMRSTGLL